jgi:hypothetical protein
MAEPILEEGPAAEMGLAAGGKIRQEIVEDYYGADTWDEECRGKVYIRIVNSVDVQSHHGSRGTGEPHFRKRIQ